MRRGTLPARSSKHCAGGGCGGMEVRVPCMPVHEGRFRGTSVSVCMRLHQPQGPHSILVKPACSIRKSTCAGQHPEEQSAAVQACLIVRSVRIRSFKAPTMASTPRRRQRPLTPAC